MTNPSDALPPHDEMPPDSGVPLPSCDETRRLASFWVEEGGLKEAERRCF